MQRPLPVTLSSRPKRPLDPRWLEVGDFRGPHHGWRGQACGAGEVGDRNVARSGRIVGADDRGHPDQAEGRKLATGDDQDGGRFLARWSRRGRTQRRCRRLEAYWVVGHARACPGLLRLAFIGAGKGVDGRDEPGNDGIL